jgi:flagellar assembly protein FliH
MSGYCFPKISAGECKAALRPSADRPESDFRRIALGEVPRECLASEAGASAAASIEEIEQQAYCRGFADGERGGFEKGEQAGREAAAGEWAGLQASVQRLLAELEGLRRRTCREMEGELVDLALAVARKITRQELSIHPQAVAAALREALDKVAHADRITVRMHPDDLQRLAVLGPSPAGDAASGRTRFEADPSVTPGGFRVETDLGDVDGRLEQQIQAISESFHHERIRHAPPLEEPAAHARRD